jgi:hypothetical protein
MLLLIKYNVLITLSNLNLNSIFGKYNSNIKYLFEDLGRMCAAKQKINLMKNLFLVTLLAFVFANANAQIKKPGVTLGGSVFYANPQGDFKTSYKGGVGGELKGGLGLGKTYLVASVGYAAFAAQSGNNFGTLTYQPIKIGVKQYFLSKRIFINGDIGIVRLKDKATDSTQQRFARDIGVGARLLGLEASIFYDTWDNLRGPEGSTKALQFKIGYNITL